MFRYRCNWRQGTDIIIMTPKGKKESGIPIGVIIPKNQDGVAEYIGSTSHNVFVAKHSDKLYEVTHIVPAGITNLFGWFVTDADLPESNWCFDIGYGWFKGKTVTDLNQIENYL